MINWRKYVTQFIVLIASIISTNYNVLIMGDDLIFKNDFEELVNYSFDDFNGSGDLDGYTTNNPLSLPNVTNQNGTKSGVAYVYSYNGSIWTQEAQLIPNYVVPNSNFGD